jgi:hypothetical protein
VRTIPDVGDQKRCAGLMQLIATIDDPAVIQRILAHLALPGAQAEQPARPYSAR